MGRLDVSADEALGLLTGGAGPDENKLKRIAAAIVAARRTPAEVAAEVLPEAPANSPPPPLDW